jgi:hypothetical protein
MDFTYVGYKDELLAGFINSDRPGVYVFDNFNNLIKAKKQYNWHLFQKESIFICMKDLKEKLFPSNRLVLKEEKLSLIFYELLREEEKRKLKIDNYFDVIDLAGEFFNFYAELNEYNIEEINNLRDWQQERYKIFQELRKRYIERMEELAYTDKTLSYDFRNFSIYFIREYREINFINIINFTNKEKEIIKRLEDTGKKVHIFMQIEPGDYDESELSIKSLSMPEKLETEIDLYQTEEDLLQIVNLISILEREKFNIFDANFDNSNYHRLLSSDKIKIDKAYSFTESKIFRFLNTLYNLYCSTDMSKGKLKIEIAKLLEASYLQEFRDYYELNNNNLEGLKELAREDYVYLSPEIIDFDDSKLKEYKGIINDIKTISRLSNLRDFSAFLENIKLGILNNGLFINNISQYFDALLELKTIENMNFIDSWEKYFRDKPRGLFRLILNYLRFKELKKIANDPEPLIEIKDLLTASHLLRNNLILVNITKGIIPSEKKANFFLTDKQCSELGLKTTHERILEEKYYFFRHIFSSKRAIIISHENLESNLSSSSFVEELKIKYSLEIRDMFIKPEQYSELCTNIFSSITDIFSDKLLTETVARDKLMIDNEDFPEKRFFLAYYKYISLKDCYYKFYLEHVAHLEEDRILIEKELSPRVFGIIVHEIYEYIINKVGLDFQVSEEIVKELIEMKFKSYDLKIYNYYKKYYSDILLNKIKNSIIYFFKIIKSKIPEEIKEIKTEWQPEFNQKSFMQHILLDLYLTGRIDLLIDTENKRYIIDFKTGKGKLEQLDFYSLLLNPALSEDIKLEKGIYSVMDEKFQSANSGKEEKFAQNIRDEIKSFADGGEYLQEYKLRCKKCIYADVCRVVGK